MPSRGCVLASLPKLALAVVCITAGCVAVLISDCAEDDGVGEFMNVDVYGCTDYHDFCPFPGGENISVAISFQTQMRFEAVTHQVSGIIGNETVPFYMDTQDACEDTGIDCPLEPGEYVYEYWANIAENQAKNAVMIRWELYGDNDTQIICVQIPGEIIR